MKKIILLIPFLLLFFTLIFNSALSVCTGFNEAVCTGTTCNTELKCQSVCSACCKWTTSCVKKTCAEVTVCVTCGCDVVTTTSTSTSTTRTTTSTTSTSTSTSTTSTSTSTSTTTTSIIPVMINLTLNGTQGNYYYLNNSIANVTVFSNVTALVNLSANITGWTRLSQMTPYFTFPSINCSKNNTWYNFTASRGNITYTGNSVTYYGICYVLNPNISSCFDLNQAGMSYNLTTDIINTNISPCINISANNVTLDCQNHNIDSNGTSAYGIYIYRDSPQNTNITIKNCNMTDWATAGIYLYSSNNNTIINSTSSNNNYGFGFYSSNNNTIINSTSSNNNYGIDHDESSNSYIINSTFNNNNNYGIFLYSSLNNNIVNSTINNNYYGIFLISGSNNNTISFNKIQNNSYGLSIFASDNTYNMIYNNLFNNTNNTYFIGFVYINYWNTTRQNGTRIYSNGTEISGNYWSNYTNSNGYSDTCVDANMDGFCDNSYNITVNDIDYLPLSNKYSITTTTIQPTPIKTYFECERKICYEDLKITPKIIRIVECDLEEEYPYFLIFKDTKDLLWEIVCEN